MTAKGWFANSATISLAGATVGALRNVRMTPKFEVVDIYALGGIKRIKSVKHSFAVDVSVEYAMWDSSADTLMEGFLAGSSDGDGAVADTISVGEFDITANVKNHDSTTTMTITASNVRFSDISVEVRENEWMSRNITGIGEDFTITYT